MRRSKKRDFILKSESVSRKRKGKREYLNDSGTRQLMKKLDTYFEEKVEIPRIRVGKNQIIETLINEETLLSGKFLRREREKWVPRISLPYHGKFREKTGEKHLQNRQYSPFLPLFHSLSISFPFYS